MPELPEIVTLARNMQQELAGRTITGVEVLQPKCLNLPEDDFVGAVQGAGLLRVTSHGKWIQAELDDGWLLLNLGMGGEILLTDRDHLPEKFRLILDLDGEACLAINFWKSISEMLPSPRGVASLGWPVPSADSEVALFFHVADNSRPRQQSFSD